MKALVVAVLVAAAAAAACGRSDTRAEAAAMTGGDSRRGEIAIRQYGCGTCHEIPGIPGATGMVGPSLHRIALRTFIAGVLPNSPEHMLSWLLDPPAVDSLTAMPNVGLDVADARDIAAYLYTLR